jgi:hypothetical protein
MRVTSKILISDKLRLDFADGSAAVVVFMAFSVVKVKEPHKCVRPFFDYHF